MGLINSILGKKPKYRSAKELGIYPGQLRYKLYQCLSEGKSPEQTYERLREEGEFKNQHRNDALRYIEYFHRRMKGEEK
jgi:hypothetical protein